MIRLSICALYAVTILNKREQTKQTDTRGGQRLATIHLILWRSIRFIQLINCIQMEMIFMKRWARWYTSLSCSQSPGPLGWWSRLISVLSSTQTTSNHRDGGRKIETFAAVWIKSQELIICKRKKVNDQL